MDNPELIQLNLEFSAKDATDEEIDRMTRRLLYELREMDVESAELARGVLAPEGSKGDPVTIGSIALEVLPALLPAVIGLVQAWVARGQDRKVKLKGKIGREVIEFEGSPQEFQKLLATLEKGKKRQ